MGLFKPRFTATRRSRQSAMLLLVLMAFCNLGCPGGSGPGPQRVSIAISPKTASVAFGGNQAFSTTVTGTSDTAVTWSVQEGAAGGTITNSGVYTAPAMAGTYHVVATSVASSSSSATAVVTVTPVVVAISPATASLVPDGSQTFTATVTGAANTAVTWSVKEGAAGGTITNAGVYTAPMTAGTYHVVATSVASPTDFGTATITVHPVVTINPTSATITLGQMQAFTATVTGSTNAAVRWSVQGGARGGTITKAGVYTAPNVPGIYHVMATSQADTSQRAIATVTVQAGSASGTIN